jgi:hypothetical protein
MRGLHRPILSSASTPGADRAPATRSSPADEGRRRGSTRYGGPPVPRESSSRAGKGLDEALERDGDADKTKPVVDVEGRTLSLSNLDKVLYPGTGFTKGQVIDYYVRIAPVLLPHTADRPLTMHRFPSGVDDPNSFYEKHRPKSAPDWVRSERVLASPKAKGPERRRLRRPRRPGDHGVGGQPGLARAARPPVAGRPDRSGPRSRTCSSSTSTPGEPATVVECAEVALLLARQVADEHGWTCYPKGERLQGDAALRAAARGRPATRVGGRRVARARPHGGRGAVPGPTRPGRRPTCARSCARGGC